MAAKINTQTSRHLSIASDPDAKNWVQRLYFTYMPKKRRWRTVVVAVVIFLALVIAGQLAYPNDRGLPLAKAGGTNLALASHDEMIKTVTSQFDATKLKLTVGTDKSVTYPLALAGAQLNTETVVARLSDYPLWQRFIPGSILWQPVQVTVADVFYSDPALQAFSQARSKELSFPPQNARLAIKDGELVATDAMAGSEVDEQVLRETISGTSMQLGATTVIETPTKRTPPQRTAQDLAEVRKEAQIALAHTIVIHADDQQFSPSRSEVASWVVLSTGKDGSVTLSIDKNKIKKYLADINKKVGTPAGQTNITLVDGNEASRTTGANGRAIDSDALTDTIAKKLLALSRPINLTAHFVTVKPSVIYDHKYTATETGLRAYVSDVARTQNMHIAIQQLDGNKWSAHARDTESIPSASTYKLYVALVLFDKMNSGLIHWNDPMLDTTVAGCFERMIVPSTNPCAEKWIAEFGRNYINNFIWARGFSHGTTFTAPDATHTTAADLEKYLIGLQTSTLISGDNRNILLEKMGRQLYRYGIPTGSAGSVQDKVGFLWDYVHDAAIVHHPKGTYVMVIMTKGQSYAAIASVTREVERIMYP